MNCIELKKDLDKLAQTFRSSEEKIYERINEDAKVSSAMNTNLELIVQKVSAFIDMFEKHDQTEMQKYISIEEAIKTMSSELKTLEDKYVTKDELKDVKNDIRTMSESIRKGFRIFWMGAGVLLGVSTLGALVLWIVNLTTKLNQLGG